MKKVKGKAPVDNLKRDAKLFPRVVAFCARPAVGWPTAFDTTGKCERFWEELHYLSHRQVEDLATDLKGVAVATSCKEKALAIARPLLEKALGVSLDDPEHVRKERVRNALKSETKRSRAAEAEDVETEVSNSTSSTEGDTTVKKQDTKETKKAGGFGKSAAKETKPVKPEKKDAGKLMDKVVKKSKPGGYDPDAKIVVKAKENPRRPGTHGHEVFKSYSKYKTVGAVLEHGGKVADIRWDEERGHIEVR